MLAQTYENIEYIIIDGQSTDHTCRIINEYKGQVTHVLSEADEGIYDAMNKGISLATGDVIGILNSDDFYPHSDVITEVVATYEQHSAVDIVMGAVSFVRDEALDKVLRYYRSVGFSPWKLRFGLMAPHPAAFIKRHVYDRIGLYNKSYKISADFEFFVRSLLVYKFNYLAVDKCWVIMRMGGASTSGITSYKISTQEMRQSFKDNNLYTNTLFILFRLPIKLLQLKKSSHE